MRAQVSLYGRLGADPVARETGTGKPMATASLACDVARHDAGQQDTEWFGLVAFGKQAKALLRHRTGDLLAVMGALTRQRWTAPDGTERSRWSVLVEAVVSARTARPAGGRKPERAAAAETGPAIRAQAPVHAGPGDQIPFRAEGRGG